MENGGGIGHVHVAAGVGEDLHFTVYAAGVTIGAVGEGEVAVDEGVLRRVPRCFVVGQSSVIVSERVAERDQLLSCGLCRGRFVGAVVEMDFDFAPAGMTVVGELSDVGAIILLGGIEISVGEGAAVVIAESLEVARI